MTSLSHTFQRYTDVLLMIYSLQQNCPEEGDYQGLQETGTAVAPGQLQGPRGEEKG